MQPQKLCKVLLLKNHEKPPKLTKKLVFNKKKNIFEVVIDFNADNDYQFIEPYGFDVFPSDVTLVYIEWETDNGEPIWRLLTQTEYFDNGVLVYNYDFTQQDVRIFLDGTINLNTLDNVWTQNQAFRVVVVPADNIDGLDVSNLDSIMQAYAIEDFELR